MRRSDVPLDQQPHGLAGRLLVVDGVDGSGKSTLAEAVAAWVVEHGHSARRMDLISPWVRQHPQFQLLADDLDAVVSGRADDNQRCQPHLAEDLCGDEEFSGRPETHNERAD